MNYVENPLPVQELLKNSDLFWLKKDFIADLVHFGYSAVL